MTNVTGWTIAMVIFAAAQTQNSRWPKRRSRACSRTAALDALVRWTSVRRCRCRRAKGHARINVARPHGPCRICIAPRSRAVFWITDLVAAFGLATSLILVVCSSPRRQRTQNVRPPWPRSSPTAPRATCRAGASRRRRVRSYLHSRSRARDHSAGRDYYLVTRTSPPPPNQAATSATPPTASPAAFCPLNRQTRLMGCGPTPLSGLSPPSTVSQRATPRLRRPQSVLTTWPFASRFIARSPGLLYSAIRQHCRRSKRRRHSRHADRRVIAMAASLPHRPRHRPPTRPAHRSRGTRQADYLESGSTPPWALITLGRHRRRTARTNKTLQNDRHPPAPASPRHPRGDCARIRPRRLAH